MFGQNTNERERELKDKIKKRFPFLVPIRAIFKNWRPRLLRWLPTYDRDGLITDAYCGFMSDELFIKARDIAVKECEIARIWRGNDWRLYVACWAGEHGKNLEGDFVECGVEKGVLSRTVMEYTGFKNMNKKFYLIDTYRGLDRRYLTASELMKEYPYPDVYQIAKKVFSGFANAAVVRGAVPEVLGKLPKINKVAYLSIDMNCVVPEIAAAEFFWNKMSRGAVMLLDDYGNGGHEEQRDAFDKFAKEKGVSVLSLPTGQGLILKS